MRDDNEALTGPAQTLLQPLEHLALKAGIQALGRLVEQEN